MSSSASSTKVQHAPYAPTTAGLGLMPSVGVDVPITAVFLALFIGGAVIHMTILQVNMRRGKKFIMSGLMFGFCMARITACTMRLVWTTHITSIPIAIAAQIFVAAGVIILFIVNVIFAQRITRATHPEIGWTKWFSWTFKLYLASIIVMLIALITCTVQSFYTLSHNTKRIDRDVQLVGSTYFAAAAFLPIPLMAINFSLPRRHKVEKFGTGRFQSKVSLILFTSFFLSLGAAFRAGTAYVPKPRADPAWYDSKACFYLFDFTIEVMVVYLYGLVRVDKRFHVPNGSKRPGDYNGANAAPADEKISHVRSLSDRIPDESEVFGEDEEQVSNQKPIDLEGGLRPHSSKRYSTVSGASTHVGSTGPESPEIVKDDAELDIGFHFRSARSSKTLSVPYSPSLESPRSERPQSDYLTSVEEGEEKRKETGA